MRKTVFMLMVMTRQTPDEILSWPKEDYDGYVDELNDYLRS